MSGANGVDASGESLLPATVIAGVQGRNEEAFRQLVRCVSLPLIRFAQSILHSLDDSEDIVQDVLVSVWELGPDWRPKGDPLAYLIASVRNRSLDQLRSRTRRSKREAKSDFMTGGTNCSTLSDELEEPNVLDTLIEGEETSYRMMLVSLALLELPEKQRTAYELRYRQGCKVSLVAEVLGISVKAAESLLMRATQNVLNNILRQSI